MLENNLLMLLSSAEKNQANYAMIIILLENQLSVLTVAIKITTLLHIVLFPQSVHE